MSGKAGRSSRRGRAVAQSIPDSQGLEPDQGSLSAKMKEFEGHQEPQDASGKNNAVEGLFNHSSVPSIALG